MTYRHTLGINPKFMTFAGRLKRFFCLAFAGSALAMQALAAAPAPEMKLTVYRGATLIDGTGAAARPDMAILVEGERIKAVVAARQLGAEAEGAEVVDAGGLHVLPGLIDAHVHLATPPNPALAKAVLRRNLYGGITAVRDMADDLRLVSELAREALAGEIPSPDIYYAAAMCGPSFFEDPRAQAVSLGFTPGKAPWVQSIDENTDLKLAVAMARGTGASAIKIYADLPASLVNRITEEARRQGMLVWTHSTVFPAMPGEVIASGPDVMSHAWVFLFLKAESTPQSFQDATRFDLSALAKKLEMSELQGLFAQMQRRNIILDATVSGLSGDLQDFAAKVTARAYRQGVPIAAGTDYQTPLSEPYTALHNELDVLSGKVGMSNADVIRAGTSVAAKALGRQDEMGTLEPGKLANLTFVSGNPLERIGALRNVIFTVKRGIVYRRSEYSPATAAEGER